jgi:CelD/BcsL family acetyltransferase involved in cellulose biosynthesis
MNMRKARPDGEVTTRVIQDEAAFNAIQIEWEALYSASPTATPPLAFDWLRGWWDVYKSSLRAAKLQVVTFWRGAQLVGAIPLYSRRDPGPLALLRLGFLSTGEAEFEEICPDYLNPLHLPGEESTCADLIWQAVSTLTWDCLELLDVPDNTPLLRSQHLPQTARRISRGECPLADLTGGYEAYLKRLSSNSRSQARRMVREGEKHNVQFEVVGPDQVDSAFGDLVRLHQERWTAEGKPGVFAAPRFVEFHRRLIGQWLPGGRAVLARLSLEGEPMAVIYGLVTGPTFYFYQSGVRLDGASPLRSPGVLAHLLLMKELAQRGVLSYDFLRGSSSYKERLATRESQLVGVEVWRRSIRAVMHRSIRFAGRFITSRLRQKRQGTP